MANKKVVHWMKYTPPKRVGWKKLDFMTTPPTGKYLVGHRGHCIMTRYTNGSDGHWHIGTKIGWKDDPFAWGATHYLQIPDIGHRKEALL